MIYSGYLGALLLYWAAYIVAPGFHGRWIQGEDRVVEWVTVAGFTASAALAFSLLRAAGRASRAAFLYFLFMGFFFLLCTGEEISWGQRIFGFTTPESLETVNEQREFNLHNLELEHIHPKDIVTWMFKGFGVILPLVFFRRLRNPADPARRYLSPLYLIPCFLFIELIGLFAHPTARLVAGFCDPEPAAFLIRHVRALTEEMREMYWAITLGLALVAIRAAWGAARKSERQGSRPA